MGLRIVAHTRAKAGRSRFLPGSRLPARDGRSCRIHPNGVREERVCGIHRGKVAGDQREAVVSPIAAGVGADDFSMGFTEQLCR